MLPSLDVVAYRCIVVRLWGLLATGFYIGGGVRKHAGGFSVIGLSIHNYSEMIVCWLALL